eukprot:572780-Hanusia_phi.AAC.1
MREAVFCPLTGFFIKIMPDEFPSVPRAQRLSPPSCNITAHAQPDGSPVCRVHVPSRDVVGQSSERVAHPVSHSLAGLRDV